MGYTPRGTFPAICTINLYDGPRRAYLSALCCCARIPNKKSTAHDEGRSELTHPKAEGEEAVTSQVLFEVTASVCYNITVYQAVWDRM